MATVTLVLGALKASSLLHYRLLSNVLRWPMAQFDSTPSGRLTNRFAKETDVIDIQLPMNFQFWLMCIVRTLSIFTILVISLRLAILALVPVGILYFFVQVFVLVEASISGIYILAFIDWFYIVVQSCKS